VNVDNERRMLTHRLLYAFVGIDHHTRTVLVSANYLRLHSYAIKLLCL